jgi:3-phytase
VRGDRGDLTEADIEGLAIYYRGGGGYLLASSQGSDEFVVYERGGTNAYVTTFSVDARAVDGVSHTDGIDVTNAALGAAFPDGLFVAQDDRNDGGNQNIKLVPWGNIARAASPALTIDTGWDPRRVGG